MFYQSLPITIVGKHWLKISIITLQKKTQHLKAIGENSTSTDLF